MNIELKTSKIYGCKEKSFLDKFKRSTRIYLNSDTQDLVLNFRDKILMEDENIFYFHIIPDKDENNEIFIDVSITELEFFANQVTKAIEIIRRDYEKQIQFQYEGLVDI